MILKQAEKILSPAQTGTLKPAEATETAETKKTSSIPVAAEAGDRKLFNGNYATLRLGDCGERVVDGAAPVPVKAGHFVWHLCHCSKRQQCQQSKNNTSHIINYF